MGPELTAQLKIYNDGKNRSRTFSSPPWQNMLDKAEFIDYPECGKVWHRLVEWEAVVVFR
jgi:hypothetical protein